VTATIAISISTSSATATVIIGCIGRSSRIWNEGTIGTNLPIGLVDVRRHGLGLG